MKNSFISPRYQMELAQQIEDKLWAIFPKSKYQNVKSYIEKWHRVDRNTHKENFFIYTETIGGKIELNRTLTKMPIDLLIKIAIDLDIETPNFIPSIPIYRNEIKDNYKNAKLIFEKALKNVETDPDVSIGLANSALESIIKEILQDERFVSYYNSKDTLSKQIENIIKAFSDTTDSACSQEFRNIASSLMKACKAIDDVRSTKSSVHGKANDDYVINDSMYAYFIVNASTTVGLFLLQFYKTKFRTEEDLPF